MLLTVMCLIIFALGLVKLYLYFLSLANCSKITKVIVFNKYFIIVNKEADLKINSNAKIEKTVQTFLRKKYPDLANTKLYHEFYFPHRLDYATSGLLCIPKDKESCRAVSEAFSSHCSKKYYIALLSGLFSKNMVNVNIPIGEDQHATEIQKMCTLSDTAPCQNAKVAQTIITVLETGTFNNYFATKVLCRLITGRRHQIRVHCSHLGHTIIGDYTYSNRKDVEPPRMYLHSIRLVLPNRVSDIDVSTEDPFTHIKYWKKIKVVQSLPVAYSVLDDYTKELFSS